MSTIPADATTIRVPLPDHEIPLTHDPATRARLDLLVHQVDRLQARLTLVALGVLAVLALDLARLVLP